MSYVIDEGPVRPAEVYRLFGASGILLYVGMAYDADRRCRKHKYTKPWWDEVSRREVTQYPTWDIADGAEAIAIATEKPRYNWARQNEAGAGDQLMRAGRIGLVPGERALISSVRAAARLPRRVAAIIGAEAGALCLYERRVYGWQGSTGWMIASWDCPRPAGLLTWEVEGEMEVCEYRRPAVGDEAKLFGLEEGSPVDVAWYTGADRLGATRALVEVLRRPDVAAATVTTWPA